MVGINKEGNPPIYQKLNKIKQENPDVFLYDYVLYPGSYKAVGAKIKYEELALAQWQVVLDAIVKDQNIRIIHLTRENRLKRYISNYIAANVTHVNVVFDITNRAVVQPITLSLEACIQDINATEEAEARFREYFKKHKVFEISYEQVVNKESNKLNELQQFLGVTPAELEVKTRKVIPDNLKDVIVNYADLQSAFRGTRFEHYLTM